MGMVKSFILVVSPARIAELVLKKGMMFGFSVDSKLVCEEHIWNPENSEPKA